MVAVTECNLAKTKYRVPGWAKKVVIEILQGSAVTQTMLGGLTIYLPVANFLWCICAKNYENWLAVDKVIAKISWLTFLAHPV